MAENKEIMEYNIVGTTVDIAQIKELLKQAVKDNLITQEEMDTVSGYRNIRKEMQLKQAIEVLCNALREDTTEGSYYHSWVCNIAMAIKDEVSRNMKKKYESGKSPYFSRQDSHECANQGAKNFLDLLIKE